ncbi:MAG TPA: CPBP family intramembrane metalloprotease [Syntrophomonadaceae bacterium]|nr:CPBP family intramembrane metalloprotease [Syntrophomonadaceae bacterium]
MEKLGHNRTLFGITVFLLLFLVQIILGKVGSFFANMIPYQKIDPYNIFAGISIHHAIQMIIAIIAIIMLSKLLKIDFYFKLGDISKGMKYLALFTAVFAIISVAVHILMLVNDQLPIYDFPLDRKNILGTLGFQLFLSGPSEEIIYRALTITMLVYAFGKSIPIKGNITLEVILASLLFSFAHINWSFNPFVFEVNFFPILYAFVLGSIQGIVFQKSKSILYPILMHSFSNVLMVGVGYLFVA